MRRTAVDTDMVPLRTAWPLWMTAETAAAYLDFSHCADPRAAFKKFASRTGLIPRGRRGDVPLYARRDLDEIVTIYEGKSACLLRPTGL